MKTRFSHIGLAKLCGWFGITRQAYYQNSWSAIAVTIEQDLVIGEVNRIRERHPRMGTRKLYELLEPFILDHKIKMGRDALFTLLAAHNLLVRKRRRAITTTQSFHWLRKYPNLITDFTPTSVNQLWVSDITYWKIKHQQHLYISFITDAYSHKIVGYHVAETLEAVESIHALKMALARLKSHQDLNLIHHSDRGIQYCSKHYVKLLKSHNVQISMSESGNPLQNAIAERVNGIIKHEYLECYQVTCIREAKKRLEIAVKLYNEERPHMSISNLTPSLIHEAETPIKVKRLWKNYYRQ